MNTRIKCLIVDDEPLAIKVIKSHIDKIDYLECVASCESAIDAYKVLNQQEIDLIFLDINMPHLSGIDFVSSLKNPPSIIFTTAYRKFAVESYELNAFDYLVKPIKFTRLLKSVDRFWNQQETKSLHTEPAQAPISEDSTPFIFVNANKKYQKVAFDDILYVESIKDYIRIHSVGKNIITRDKISDFEQKLPKGFLRIHRSFIVNLAKISAFTATDVEIGAKEIPIGVSYKEKTLAYLKAMQ